MKIIESPLQIEVGMDEGVLIMAVCENAVMFTPTKQTTNSKILIEIFCIDLLSNLCAKLTPIGTINKY